jgi:hypothetical protein
MVGLSIPLAPSPTTGCVPDPAMARPPAAWHVRVITAWLVLVVILLTAAAPQIAAVRFNDPDDALRLMEVRDLLGGQGWFDLHQYRIAAPEGVPMHWSRLVDIPLAGMIWILRPLVGAPLAEMITLVSVPLLTLLAALTLVGRLTAKFFDTETVGIACLVMALGTPLTMQMMPMRIDHHGWQIVLALAALNGLAARQTRDGAIRGGLVIGLALAALLAISIEGLPITAVFLGVLALRGLNGRGYAGFASASVALAVGSGLIFLGTRGLGDLASHCDQISPIHLALFAVVALGSWAMVVVAPRRWPVALAMLGATAAATLALYLGVAPQCKGGAFVALDPMIKKYWYENIAEGMPFWHSPLPAAIELVGVPLVGLLAIGRLWRDAKDAEERSWWFEHALVLAGALLVGAVLARASATACGIAAMPTAALVLRCIVALRTVTPLRRVAGYLGILVLLMPPLPVMAWARLEAARTGSKTIAGIPTPSICRYRVAARGLNALPPTDMFMPLDIGPDILVRTRQRAVATGHHRGAAGMQDVMTAFLGTPDEAHAIIRRRHATLIAICPDTAEPSNYKYYAPNGFMAQLLRGQTPPWLERVDLAPGSNLLYWRVKG